MLISGGRHIDRETVTVKVAGGCALTPRHRHISHINSDTHTHTHTHTLTDINSIFIARNLDLFPRHDTPMMVGREGGIVSVGTISGQDQRSNMAVTIWRPQDGG